MSELSPRELPRVLGPVLQERFAISRSRLRTEVRRGSWQRLAAGIVLTRPDEPTRADWADVGLVLAGAGAAVTGWDAARARGIGRRAAPSDPVVVLSPVAMNRLVGGVRIRRTRRRFTRHFQPLGSALEMMPVVGLARAVTDTAVSCHDLGDVRALVAAAVQRGRCSVPELLAEYEDGPRNGSKLLRVALSDLADGARSAAEAIAARRLCCAAIPPFELNVPIIDQHGTLIRVVDALWRELRAALEIDSREYHFDEAGWTATMQRHNQLTRCGLALTHYSPRLITRRGSTFVGEVAAWLRARASELGVPLPSGRGVRRPPRGAAPAPLRVIRA